MRSVLLATVVAVIALAATVPFAAAASFARCGTAPVSESIDARVFGKGVGCRTGPVGLPVVAAAAAEPPAEYEDRARLPLPLHKHVDHPPGQLHPRRSAGRRSLGRLTGMAPITLIRRPR